MDRYVASASKYPRSIESKFRNHHPLGSSRVERIEPIEIGKNVILGDYSIVLLGAKIPDNTVVPPMTVVTASSPYTMAPSTREEFEIRAKKLEALQMSAHYLPFEYELELRSRLADGKGVLGCESENDLGCLRVKGPLDKITVTEGSTDFYARPWGPPQIFVSEETFGGVSLGENSFVHHSSQLVALRHSIKVGKYCNISWRCAFLADLCEDGKEALRRAMNAPGSILQEEQDNRETLVNGGDVILEDSVWIGANCIILPGTYIGRGSMVGAGSVVAGYVPPFSVVCGNPAVVKRSLSPFIGRHGSGVAH